MPATTAAIAQELVALCREGKNLDAIARLYSPQVSSTEPVGGPDMPATVHGIDAVRGKNEWWFNAHDVHSSSTHGPFVGEHEFVVQYEYDATHKESGRRMLMRELAHYTVKDGKIVREEFFYHMPGM
jgi:ketosteroid isomerase-like protein